MSDLRVTNLRGRTTGVSPTLPDGAVVTGVTTTTTLAVTGVATAASSVVAGIVTANVSGIHAGVGIITARGLEATGIVTATSFNGSAASLKNLNATQLTSGTVPDARFPATLPAVDGSALTNLNIPAGFTELDAALFN